VLAQSPRTSGGSLIVEGIRHVVIAEAITRLIFPASFRLVLVLTPDGVREQRLADEGLLGNEARAKLDAHSTEREVLEGLASLASLIVDGSGDVDAAARTILDAIEKWKDGG
jgi:hypothetical protein